MTANAQKGLVIVPTYNEAGNIAELILKIYQQGLGLDILVIDDNSPDGTGRIAEELASEAPVKVMRRKGKLGIGSAHKDGFRYAMEQGYYWAITMDADFSHSPEVLPQLLAGTSTADVVIGSRYIPGGGLAGWSWPRRLLTHTAHWMTQRLLGIPYDCTGGFRLYPVSVLRQIRFDEIRSEGYAFLIEMIDHVHRKGLSVHQIPIVINSRDKGQSKISRREVFRAVKTLLRLSVKRGMNGAH